MITVKTVDWFVQRRVVVPLLLPLPARRSPARPVALATIADDSIEDHGLFVGD